MPVVDYLDLYDWARAVDAAAADSLASEFMLGQITSSDYADRLKKIIDAGLRRGR